MVMASVSIALASAPRTRRIAARPAPPTSNSEPAPARRRRHSTSAGPLKGVVAMVDVRVGADAQIDCSDVVARKLRELGASTVKRFTPKLTHMVLSHFTPAWKAKIVKWQGSGGSMAAAATRHDLKIASQLWVNACYVSKQKMAERPFFPVSQTPDTIAAPSAPAVGTGGAAKRRQSLGADASRPMSALSSTDGGQNTLLLTANTNGGNAATTLSTPPTSTFKITKTAANGNRRKRRALSMEPMTSDAILKMLGSTTTTPEVIDLGTPTQPIRSKSATSSAKRRRTISVPPSAEKAIDKSSESQATTVGSECVPESESEHEEDDKSKDSKAVEGEDKQPSLSALTGSSGTSSTSSGEFAVGATGSSKKEPTARELRRANRTSLTYGSGLALKSGIWSCVACGCSNPRARKFCTDCRTPKEFAKQKTPHAAAAPAAATAASVKPPKTPVTEATAPSVVTAVTVTPRRMTRSRTPSPSTRTKIPSSPTQAKTPSPAIRERSSRSVTRATASSAAKARTPSPAMARASRGSTSSVLSSSASVVGSSAAPLKTPAVRKKPQRPPTTGGFSSAMKLTQSAAKRVRPPASSNTLTTPAVKKARHGNTNEKTLDDKFMATPGSVSCFPRKYRDVNSTPITAIPMAMKFSSTTTSKKPARKMRNVIGITGVNSETRGVLECAIHAIDANVSSESGHRKARVVKSLDYAAGVTHLIVGKETRRTIKVLFAIARGAWIVSEGWAFSSLEKERWLPEEDFELTMFGNKQSRLHPESRQIFKGMKFFVGSNVEPSREVLQSLIQVAGGEICNQISVADMCICGDGSLFRRAQRTGIRVVTSKWVFDSIASMTLEDDAKYSFAERPELEVPSSGVSAVAETKSGRAVVSNLEAQSTVLE